MAVVLGEFIFGTNMRIGVVVNTTWNVLNFRLGLINGLMRDGHEVHTIAPEDQAVADLENEGITCHHIRMDRSGLNPVEDLGYLRQLKKILKSNQIDLVLSFTIKSNIYASLIARHLKIPIIANVSGLGTSFLWKNWIQKIVIKLYKLAFKRTDFIFFQNKDDSQLFLSNIPIDKEKTGLLPGSGINLEKFQADPPGFVQPITFLMISRLIIEKGVLEYMKAADELGPSEQYRFQIVGSYDPEHARSISPGDFEKLRSSEAIEYIGELRDVKPAITDADVIVLPSYREGTPRTLLEGAAMSRPLIATDVPGCREVVSHGANGFLCKYQDSEDLKKVMHEFLNLEKHRMVEMAQNSRKICEDKFDERLVINAYRKQIQKIIKISQGNLEGFLP